VRLHGQSMILRDRGNKLAIITQICQLRFLQKADLAVVLLVVKSVSNRLLLTLLSAFFRTSRPIRKSPSALLLYLTVFWFRLTCISNKTIRNTVNLSGYPKVKYSMPH
jgi:hypothetical protein